LGDAIRNTLLPPPHLVEALPPSTGQKPLLRLPRGSEDEMMMVTRLVSTPWQRVRVSTETDNGISASPGLREGETDFISHLREREGDSIFPLRKRERGSDSVFLGEERGGGRKSMRFDRPGAGCRHRHRHEGGKMKFRHFHEGDEDHFRFRPEFRLSSEDPRLHGEDAVASFRSFPGEFLSGAENEEFGFESQEGAMKRLVGEPVFPEREKRVWELPNEEEQKHGRQEHPAALWMDWLRSLFPCHGKLL